ncbi:MAG TPA: nucleoside-diphosphate kinase [Planctomycetota bacterium]|nr:nucleoside-diphosphate kinase [Planctomycetota bacterium]HRR81104.1 nucleoside-diphosphate kinase [Planctomycetota bacterium]HRT93480.1 nucleoside-diphosphate kinase [Planctomycetota bacterium]
MERTLVLIKPDAVQRRLVGRIVARFEAKGLQLVALKMMKVSEELARRHYAPHEGKPFYEPLIRFMTGGPTVALILEGKRAVEVVRRMMGPTFGPDAPPGTLRGDFAVSNRFNLVHGSDSPETAEKEIALFFDEAELVDWWPDDMEQVYDFSEGGEPV